jgi:hypothetical protein
MFVQRSELFNKMVQMLVGQFPKYLYLYNNEKGEKQNVVIRYVKGAGRDNIYDVKVGTTAFSAVADFDVFMIAQLSKRRRQDNDSIDGASSGSASISSGSGAGRSGGAGGVRTPRNDHGQPSQRGGAGRLHRQGGGAQPQPPQPPHGFPPNYYPQAYPHYTQYPWPMAMGLPPPQPVQYVGYPQTPVYNPVGPHAQLPTVSPAQYPQQLYTPSPALSPAPYFQQSPNGLPVYGNYIYPGGRQ